jgi:hypothetical protein
VSRLQPPVQEFFLGQMRLIPTTNFEIRDPLGISRRNVLSDPAVQALSNGFHGLKMVLSSF